MKKILLFLLGVLIALPGIARDFSYTYEGQTLKYTVLDETAKTCKTMNGYTYTVGGQSVHIPGNSVSGNLVIPSIAKDGNTEYTVTSIGDKAFWDCSGLTSVTIGNSVTSIGDYAFDGCSGLTSVTIGNSVTSIGENAFYKCNGLTSVTIGNSVTSIGDKAFWDCSGLTSVTIPNSVTSIGNKAFNGCTSLNELKIEDGEETLSLGYNYHYDYGTGEGLFYDCPLETIYLGRTLSYDASGHSGYSPFKGKSSLKNLTIGNSVTSIGGYAFYECSSLTSVTIPNLVTSIGNSAFYKCSGLTSVTIPNSVTSIGKEAFYKCSGLTSVTIGNSVTSIGESAFYDCIGLTEVIIPGSVTSIGNWAFANCSGLKKSAYPNTLRNPFPAGAVISYNPSGAIIEDGFIFGPDKSAIYYAPLSLEGEYSIPSSVTIIGAGTFYGCSGLTSVTIPNSVTSIGGSAFEGCSGLTSVTKSPTPSPQSAKKLSKVARL